ncbi:tyrosine-type recombinase/integrase [Mycolicibacterium moriokaense]|uniref:Site-specific recombinase XerD n=1 Tax=Mycolicibacterium moriokaense TaxID=39691 RepID=A0A318HL28_9MYCO|nr:tyrosine-type recombinase/integrase [Mycolicibacterium moriokaense]PXX11881.1 site-specific recombinase XerD [Mycolicibacterium moriokaense]
MNGDTPAESRARHHARRCGLRLSKRGGAIELLDGDTAVCRGDIADIEAYIEAKHPRRRPGGKPKPECAVPPAWAQIVDDYVLSLVAAGLPPSTLALRRIQLVRMARDLGSSPADVTADTLVAWFGNCTGWTTETRRSYRAAIRGFWRWAYRTKRVAEHLADELPKVRERRRAPRPAPDHVWQAALEAADARTTLMLRLAAEVGMRRGEVSRVHTRDLLEGGGGAQLVVKGKGDKERIVPISESLAEAISLGASGHTPGAPTGGWLFPNGTGGHLTAHHVGSLVVRVLPSHWTMHTLRHRAASRAYRGTRNLRAVQQLLGHSSVGTTEFYCAVDDFEIRAAMEAAHAGVRS